MTSHISLDLPSTEQKVVDGALLENSAVHVTLSSNLFMEIEEWKMLSILPLILANPQSHKTGPEIIILGYSGLKYLIR